MRFMLECNAKGRVMATIISQGSYKDTRENLEEIFINARDKAEGTSLFCLPEFRQGISCFAGDFGIDVPAARHLRYEGIKPDPLGRPLEGPSFSRVLSDAKFVSYSLTWEVLPHFDATVLPPGRYRLDGWLDYCLFGQCKPNPWGDSSAGISASTGGDRIFKPSSLLAQKVYPGELDNWVGDTIGGFCEFELSDLLSLGGFGVKLYFTVKGGLHVQFLGARYSLSKA